MSYNNYPPQQDQMNWQQQNENKTRNSNTLRQQKQSDPISYNNYEDTASFQNYYHKNVNDNKHKPHKHQIKNNYSSYFNENIQQQISYDENLSNFNNVTDRNVFYERETRNHYYNKPEVSDLNGFERG